jgi:inorganic triphosphatase YgiF
MAAQKQRQAIETELKIKISHADLEKVFRSLHDKNSAAEILHKYRPRAYYDTPDLAFYHAGLSLRVQYKPGKEGQLGCYEQTLKVEMVPDKPLGDAVMLRRECKDNIKSPKPSVAVITDAEGQAAAKPFKGRKLTHIFTAAIERRYFEIEVRQGENVGMVEVAFDVGQLILAQKNIVQNFSEIEVEVKQGSPELIEAVKNEILTLAPSAKVQPLSKSAQGSRLYLHHKK